MKALLPYYAGQVKCIYIDPPYNTGNEAWVYNDNVNSPEMKEWLGKVVGGEGEDLSRHDKWLWRFLVVEYKGFDRWSDDDSKEKRAIGQVWEEKSDGHCLFVMPKGQDWNAILAKLGE